MSSSEMSKRTPSPETFTFNNSGRPRFSIEHEGEQRRTASRQSNENRAPSLLPSTLSSMLKNTTETGDIGMFSMKPPRYPGASTKFTQQKPIENALRAPIKPSHSSPQFQRPPYGAPRTDDRKRLPSYLRDGTSDFVSVSETDSQNSGRSSRMIDTSDHRSMSMTQTSYNSSALLNHRSYASLRSQPERNGIQRPRSPFAYPTRLKRPGFRPSSPALTDNGSVDYRRRAEIERLSNDSLPNKSTQSLQARRRPPKHLMLHLETNGSSSNHSNLRSPRGIYDGGNRNDNGKDWDRRSDSTPLNSSPTKSTYSYTSTFNTFRNGGGGSITPGKLRAPSPLYYDYTEQFESPSPEEEPLVSVSQPMFEVQRTIPEDREMSSEWSPVGNHAHSSHLLLAQPQSEDLVSQIRRGLSNSSFQSARTARTTLPPRSSSAGLIRATSPLFRDTSASPLSETGSVVIRHRGEQVHEGLNHKDERQPEDRNFSNPVEGIPDQSPSSREGMASNIEDRTSLYSMSTNMLDFPKPPAFQGYRYIEEAIQEHQSNSCSSIKMGEGSQPGNTASLSTGNYGHLELLRDDSPILQSPRTPALLFPDHTESTLSKAESQTRPRDSRFYSIDPYNPELAEVGQLLNKFDAVDRSRMSFQTSEGCREGYGAPIVNMKSERTTATNVLEQRMNSLSKVSSRSGKTYHGEGEIRGWQSTASTPDSSAVLGNRPNIQHRQGRQLEAGLCSLAESTSTSSATPMLAPKAISPHRQLRLKNSVPQLMKALPPLPKPADRGFGLASNSPLEELHAASGPQSELVDSKKKSSQLEDHLRFPGISIETVVEINSTPVIPERSSSITPDSSQVPPVKTYPSRLKLKSRSSTSLPPLSPVENRPWNLAESYPWMAQESRSVGIEAYVSEKSSHERLHSKFKLRVNRQPTISEDNDTVKINKTGASHKMVVDIHSAKDLFTSSSELVGGIFRQVSRKFSPQSHTDTSISTENFGTHETIPAIRITSASEASRDRGVSLDLGLPIYNPQGESVTATGGLFDANTPTEIRSFFSEDSSHGPARSDGNRSLRKRFSNLRSHLHLPYAFRSQPSRSYDNVNYHVQREEEARAADAISGARVAPSKGQFGGEPTSSRARFVWNAEEVEHIEVKYTHRHRLKLKVSSWLKGTRRVMSRYVLKKRYSDEVALYPGT